jgi:hypothetical protein
MVRGRFGHLFKTIFTLSDTFENSYLSKLIVSVEHDQQRIVYLPPAFARQLYNLWTQQQNG